MRSCSLSRHADELVALFAHPSPVRFLREADDIYLTAALTDMAGRASANLDPIEVQVFDPATGIGTLSGVERTSAVCQLPAYLELKRADWVGPGVAREIWWIRGCADFVGAPESRSALRALGNLIRVGRAGRRSVRVIVSGTDEVPLELNHVAASLDLSRPRQDALVVFLEQLIQDGSRLSGQSALIARALRGLDVSAVARIVTEAEAQDLSNPLQVIRDLRDRHIRKSGVVEVLAPARRFDEVGGLEHLKQWIQDRAFVFANLEHAKLAKVDPPRGVLLAGLPGCGKSLVAEVTAERVGIPLLRLDVGRLMGKYLGESERNLREALALAEAAAPCVMWIDEIEKGLSASGSEDGSGTGGRVLGHLLTWMQEGQREVFIVATANDVERLPPELLRRGRFDEMFLLGLPTSLERADILKKSVTRRGQDIEQDLLKWLASDEKTVDYSGADLDALVGAAIEDAWGHEGALLAREHFDAVFETGFVSHAKQWGDRSKAMQLKLTKHGFRPASVTAVAPLRAVRRRVLGEHLPPPSLQRFIAAPAVVVRWEVEGETFTLHFQSEASERVARLGLGPLNFVFEADSITTYAVLRGVDCVRLEPRVDSGNGRAPLAWAPRRDADMVCTCQNDGTVEIVYNTVAGVSVRARITPVERNEGSAKSALDATGRGPGSVPLDGTSRKEARLPQRKSPASSTAVPTRPAAPSNPFGLPEWVRGRIEADGQFSVKWSRWTLSFVVEGDDLQANHLVDGVHVCSYSVAVRLNASGRPLFECSKPSPATHERFTLPADFSVLVSSTPATDALVKYRAGGRAQEMPATVTSA